MTNQLMCHVVAGYPDTETCLALLGGMQAAGVAAIEVQIPFSDPIADGETIMHANDVAIANGMTIASSFELIATARKQGLDCGLYVMSYLQKIRHFGFEAFCSQAQACDVRGLIVPDLPYDSPEFVELTKLAKTYALLVVPVLSPGMPAERLDTILSAKPATMYATSQRGITGNAYKGGSELQQLINTIRKQSKATIMIGFGITSPDDVREALKLGDIAVVGSAVITKLQTSNLDKTLSYISSLTAGKS